MNIAEAKSIPIDDFLANAGMTVAKVSGGCKFYLSPYRSENHASFKLSRDRMAWFDHGTGEGGNIIDLAYRLKAGSSHITYPMSSQDVKDALELIENVVGFGYAIPTIQQRLPVIPEPSAYIIEAALPFSGVGKGASWCRSRGINPEVLRPYASDVYFNRRVKPVKRPYYAFGLMTQSDSCQGRTKLDGEHWMKTSIGPMDISVFKSKYNPDNHWLVCEGLPDFGTFLTLQPQRIGMMHCLILNTVSMTGRAIEYLKTQEPGHLAILSQRGQPAKDSQQALEDFAGDNGWDGGNYNHMFMDDSIDFNKKGELIGPSDLNEWHMRKLGMKRVDGFGPQARPHVKPTPTFKP